MRVFVGTDHAGLEFKEHLKQALTEKGYDVNHTWGIGTHSNKQAGAILPEMLRWLWRDYPRSDDPRDDSYRAPLVPNRQ